jgi:hypothetical protein
MSESSSQPHGVMEGGGAYNRYAKPQAQGIESALSLLEQVVRDTTIDDGNDPVVMADYGSSQGSITADTRARMVLGSYPRGRRELLAPFAANGNFQQLILQHCETLVPVDAAWVAYQQDGDKEALAKSHARFFRSTFMPSLASALPGDDNEKVLTEFGDGLETALQQRITNRPMALDLVAEVIIVAKQI